MTRRLRAAVLSLFAAFFGCIAVLAQPPTSLFWALLVALPGLYVLWHNAGSARCAFLVGWAAGLGYFSIGLHWIAEAFLVDAATFAWMIPFALGGLAAGLAVFWGLGFWLARRIAGVGWGAPFALAGCWMLADWLRGNVLTGFPWALVGYAWIETPAMQGAALVGIYGMTLATLFAGVSLGRLFVRRTTGSLAAAGIGMALIGICWLYGLQRDRTPLEVPTLRVGLVQPNVAQRDKWQPHLQRAQLDDLLMRTRHLVDGGADVILWPEAATPYDVEASAALRDLIADALGQDAMLLAGAIRFDGEGEGRRAYNSLLAVGPKGDLRGHYDKRHLVPFGEYLPFDEALTALGLRAMVTLPGGMSAGGESGRVVNIAGLPPFAAMICYEAIFPAEILHRSDSRRDVRWMVQVTNDAWFGASAGPHQHFVQARVRAIERGLPLARAANTGISALVGPDGAVRSALPLNEAGVVVGDLPPPLPPTFYARWEDIPFGVALVFVLAMGYAAGGRRGAASETHVR